MKRVFKSLDQAQRVGEAMKKEIGFINFGAKSIKEVGTGDQSKIEIEGYASTKDRDRYGDIVEPKAFEKTMATYMDNPMLLLQHDPNKQIGVVTSGEIDKTGLYIKADVKYKAGDDELFDKITNGDLKGFSIGFRIKELELLEEIKDGNNVWTWLIKELELLEISVVTIPANPYTLMKSLDELFKKSFDEIEKEIEPEKQKSEDGDGDPWKGDDEEPKPKKTDDKKENEPEVEQGGDVVSEEEPLDEEKPEKVEIDNEDEANNIDESGSDEPENPTETEESGKAGGDEEKKSESFTLKMLDKLVEAKTKSLEKDFEAKVKNIQEELEKKFSDKLKEFETENVKTLEGMFEIIQMQKDSIKSLSDGLKNMTSGKGFIYTEVKQLDNTGDRDKEILSKFAKMKNFNS